MNAETLPEPEPNRCPECGGLRSMYADDCDCAARAAVSRLQPAVRHALATALRFLANPRLRPEDIHAGMTGGGTRAMTHAELLRLADVLEGR